jgi:hypothetical protein
MHMKWEDVVRYNIQLSNEPPEWTRDHKRCPRAWLEENDGWSGVTMENNLADIRYMQIGFADRGRFTGFAEDYCGGGSYDRFYFIDGIRFEYEWYGDREPYLRRIVRREMTRKYPGAWEHIHRLFRTFVRYDDGYPVATMKTVQLYWQTEPGRLIGGGMLPISVGNTIFMEKQLFERGRRVVTERGRIMTHAQFEAEWKRQQEAGFQ